MMLLLTVELNYNKKITFQNFSQEETCRLNIYLILYNNKSDPPSEFKVFDFLIFLYFSSRSHNFPILDYHRLQSDRLESSN